MIKTQTCWNFYLISISLFFLSSPPAWTNSIQIRDAFLNRYCLECHDEDVQKGDVRLDDLPIQLETSEDFKRWKRSILYGRR